MEKVNTLIVGGGQAGLAMSAHLSDRSVPHLICERDRVAESWRSQRWDSLVANGPAWHDRFPPQEFGDVEPDGFAPKDSVVKYFEEFAGRISAPIRCGVDVRQVRKKKDRTCFVVETSAGMIEANNVVAATGAFQIPVMPQLVPAETDVRQLHSSAYRNPDTLADGAVLVIGAGSSGTQIAEELIRFGRRVYLSIGPHDRPPRSYRGHDYCHWLGVLGKWQMKAPPVGREHVTIAVSGAYGGQTVDFRRLAARGIVLLGMARDCRDGVMSFASDLCENLARGDANYLSVLDEADAYIEQNELDLPEDTEARVIDPDPDCVVNPILELNLTDVGISTIIWATGFRQDFSWLNVGALDKKGKPTHHRGVSTEPGIYFLGLPWLSMRGSSFIWGVWEDAEYLARHIADRSGCAEI